MRTDLQDFHSDFLNSVRAGAAAEGSFTEQSFVEEFARRLTEAEEVDNLTPGHFEGLGISNKKKIGFDGYDFGDEEGHVVLAVSHFVNAETVETLGTTEANRLFGLVVGFVEAVLSGDLLRKLEESSTGYQVARQLADQIARTFKIRIYLLTNCALGVQVKGFSSRELGPITVEFHPWDIQRLQRVQESGSGREEIEIDLNEWQPGGAAVPESAHHVSVCRDVLVCGSRVCAGGRVQEVRQPSPRVECPIVPERPRQRQQGDPRNTHETT